MKKQKAADSQTKRRIRQKQPDRTPSEMGSTQDILVPVRPSEAPKIRGDLRVVNRD